MQVADVKYGEAIEQRRQFLEPDVIVPEHHAFGIPFAPPVETDEHQRDADQGMDRIPILDVKESQALAEGLRFVIGLDPQPLLRMHRSATLLQLRQNVFVHVAMSCWM